MILIGIFVILLLLGVPIAITIGLATIGALFIDGIEFNIIAIKMFSGVSSFSMMAIPFFVFSGDLMLKGGCSKRLIKLSNTLVGWITGGIPITAVISSMFFAALSGSSPATVAAIGGVMIPNLDEANYDKKFSAGLICAAGSLGIIIPPSITMLTYGVVSETSIGDLFIAAIIPGVFIGCTLMIASYIISKNGNYAHNTKRPSIKEIVIGVKEAIWALLMPIIILGGIYSGFFTATEAAAISIVYSMFIGLFIYKELKFSDIIVIARKSVITSSMIMLVISVSKLFGWYLTYNQVPIKVTKIVLSYVDTPILILLSINVLLLVVGMLMDPSAAVLILTPLLLPVIKSIGVSPIHFGVIMIVNLAIGMITPPFGLNLFIASGISKMDLTDIIKGALPFVILLTGTLLIITFAPQLSLILL